MPEKENTVRLDSITITWEREKRRLRKFLPYR